MKLSPITLVLKKSVPGVPRIELRHQSVTINLGEYRGGRNTENFSISFDDRFVGASGIKWKMTINEKMNSKLGLFPTANAKHLISYSLDYELVCKLCGLANI